MACGKTTFGRALARAMGREFIDLDFYIEQRFRLPIGAMFAEGGEDLFRRREAAMLREVGEFEDVVVACGGGTPCFAHNIDYMISRGTVVFLEASTDRMVRRLMENNSRRPLMAGKSEAEIRETVARGLEARMPHYLKAHIRFSGENLEDSRQIDSSVAQFISDFGSDLESGLESDLQR